MTVANLDDEDDTAIVPFLVWVLERGETDAQTYHATTARQAAEKRAREDYSRDPSWQEAYTVRDGATGDVWSVHVVVVQQPSFVAIAASEELMPPATHVLWGGNVLCEDLRLRSVPRDWPDGQRWISLADVADGTPDPSDGCATCWAKAPGLIDGLRKIGKTR